MAKSEAKVEKVSALEVPYAEVMRLLQQVDASGLSLTAFIEEKEVVLKALELELATLKGLRDLKGIVALPRKPRADKGKPRAKPAVTEPPAFDGGTANADPAGPTGEAAAEATE